MKTAGVLALVAGVVVGLGIALVVLLVPVKDSDGDDCGSALSPKTLFLAETHGGITAPISGDLCDSAPIGSHRAIAAVAFVVLVVLGGIVALMIQVSSIGNRRRRSDWVRV